MTIKQNHPILITEQGINHIESYRKETKFETPFQIPDLIKKLSLSERSYYYTYSGKIQIINPVINHEKQNKNLTKINPLDTNLKLARKVIEFIKQHIFLSSNYPYRDIKYRSNNSALDLVLNYIRERGISNKEWINRAMKYNVGNCVEMSHVGLLCPELQTSKSAAEIFTIEWPGDHVFLVIGRNPLTDPTTPSSWNDDAVVCDPWAESFYPAKLIETVLLDVTNELISSSDSSDPESCVCFPQLINPRGRINLYKE